MKCHTIVLILTLLCPGVYAEDWKDTAAGAGLNRSATAQLEQDKILISDEAYRQVFSPYVGNSKPVLITSDSLLNAFHILLEETVLIMENTNISLQEDFLRSLLRKLEYAGEDIKGNPELEEAARRRAKLVTGIALRLMDPTFRFNDSKLDTIAAKEVELIEQEKAVMTPPPEWAGPFSEQFPGIEYNRFKPRGFYTRSERLSRYFRARAWLQAIPFRISNDPEFLGLILITEPDYSPDAPKVSPMISMNWFVGVPGGPNLFYEGVNCCRLNLDQGELEKERAEYLRQLKNYKSPQGPPPVLTLVTPSVTPTGRLFRHSMRHKENKRPLPTGLEAATVLGSDYANKLLTGSGEISLLPDPESWKILFPESVYLDLDSPRMTSPPNLPSLYYRALRLLLASPPDDAPAFMRSQAWQIKSLNTTLASWAQMRHTMVLQAKQSILWMCCTDMPAGFVEPNPAFFEQMSFVAGAVQKKIEGLDQLEADYSAQLEDLKTYVTFASSFKTEEKMWDAFHDLPEEQQGALLLGDNIRFCAPDDDYEQSVEWLQQLADDVERGHIEKYPDIKACFDYPANSLSKKWKSMARLCSKLESIAHKQLRNVPLTQVDEALIKSYGKELSSLMLYDGNSYLNPRDDAPRIADVFSNIDQGTHLQVGIGRARKMYILYPWQGKEVLCEGAILPYYEFASPQRMNDAEWKTMLDSDKRPSIPDWLVPIVHQGRLSRPTFDNMD